MSCKGHYWDTILVINFYLKIALNEKISEFYFSLIYFFTLIFLCYILLYESHICKISFDDNVSDVLTIFWVRNILPKKCQQANDNVSADEVIG
jgi:hypothetical protein